MPALEISVSKAKSSFSEILGRVAYGGQQFVIQRRGKPLAAVIGMAEYEEFLAFKRAQRLTRFQRLREVAGDMPEDEALALAQAVTEETRHPGAA
ncbi:MAG: type II toxin-antitoxin system Phd/YefM family antitoxin [Anaerolineae bacterium]